MKYIYQTKLLKQTQNRDPVMEKMVSGGWSLHKTYKEGLVFKKQVPENWIRAWFISDWELKNGESVEVRIGPYSSEDEAKNILNKISDKKSARIDRTWIAPVEAEPEGSRMDRVAGLFCGEPTHIVEMKKEEAPPEAVVTNVVDEHGEWSVRTTVEPLDNRINTIGVRSNSATYNNNPAATAPHSVSADEIPRIRNYLARATSRRASPSMASPRARSHPPVNRNILDSMRNFGKTQPTQTNETDEPSEEDLRAMERNRQAAGRHDQ